MKKEMRCKRLGGLLIFMSVWISLCNAQSNLVFYHTNDQLNSSGFNPAFLNSQKKFVFSAMPLSGFNVSYNNQQVVTDMINKISNGEQTNDDFREVFNSMVKLKLFYQKMETPLLMLGYHNPDIGSFNFRVKENFQLITDLKGSFSEFLTNASFLSIPLNQPQEFPALALHYREFSLGFAREFIDKKLSVGITAKLYFGKFSLNSGVQGLVVRKDNNFYLQTQNKLRISLPMTVVPEADSILRNVELNDDFTAGKYLLNPKNSGTGFDIGFSYQISPSMMVSASVIDIGSIKWRNNLKSMIFNGKYQFPQDFISSGGIDMLTRNTKFSTDSTKYHELYKIKVDESPFSLRLPTTIFTGLKYSLNPQLDICLTDRFISTKKMSLNSFSVNGIFSLNKKLTITAGYSIIGDAYANLPFAVLHQWETGQFFVGTDNLLSFVLPSLSEFSGITFGTCLFLFHNRVKYEKQTEYLPFYKQKKTKPISKKGLIFNNPTE